MRTNRTRRRARGRAGAPHKHQLPFSLILPPVELATLRKLARKENVSVATVIRRAIHTAIGQTHPEFNRKLVTKEVEDFLESIKARFPAKTLNARKQRLITEYLVKALV